MSTDYDAALEFLYGRIDYERAPTIPYQEKHLKLKRMERLLELVGDPQRDLAVIHIAGTKGKGSTATMISSILAAADLKAGLYSSPHLNRLEERIRINGQPCSAGQIVDLVAQVAPAVQQLDDEDLAFQQASHSHADQFDFGKPTYFEIMTAMSMLHFRQQDVDYAILEVGLGGRLDSTNVCDPAITVITSISFDHMKQLGNTLESIATEKAGIIKPGVPLVSGVRSGEARKAIERVADAQDTLVPRTTLGTDFELNYVVDVSAGGRFDYVPNAKSLGEPLRAISLGMLGEHQATNAAIATSVVRLLSDPNGVKVSDEAIRNGLASAQCPARIEQMADCPPVILDAAHNGASIAALLSVLDERFGKRDRVILFGTTSGKNVEDMLELLVPSCSHLVLTQYRENPRSYPADKLALLIDERLGEKLNEKFEPTANKTSVTIEANAIKAWDIARELAGDEKLICVTGSFFLAAELRPTIQRELGIYSKDAQSQGAK